MDFPNQTVQLNENELALLRDKIESLNKELERTTAEKIQSAQYGLVLLVRLPIGLSLLDVHSFLFCAG